MDYDSLNSLASYISQVLVHYGFDAAADRQTLTDYLLRRFPDHAEDAELAAKVLFLPRYMDSLKWVLFDPAQKELHTRMQAYYTDMIAVLDTPSGHKKIMQYLHMRLYDLMRSVPRGEDGMIQVSEPFIDSVHPSFRWNNER